MRFAFTLNAGYNREPCDTLNHSYVCYFQKLGLVPMLIPNVITDPCEYVDSLGVQGFILTGGNDISPERYGGDPACGKSASQLRDQIESRLLELAIRRNLPVLGICRGIHSINVFLGGSLIPNLESLPGSTVNHVGHCHANSIVDPEVRDAVGVEEYTVNSFHNQGITEAVLAPDLRVFAVCRDDGVVEGVLHPVHPIMGIQWHPERPGSSEDRDLRLIHGFLEGAFSNVGSTPQ